MSFGEKQRFMQLCKRIAWLRRCGATTALKACTCVSIITRIVQTVFCIFMICPSQATSFLNRSVPSVRFFASPHARTRSPKRRSHICHRYQVCSTCRRPSLAETTDLPDTLLLFISMPLHWLKTSSIRVCNSV